MLYSMTGYAKSAKSFRGGHVNVEIKSLNSKFLDVNLKYPVEFKQKENEIRNLLKEHLIRGKMDCYISIDYEETEASYALNKDVVRTYYMELKTVLDDLGVKDNPDPSAFIHLPDVMQKKEREFDEKEWKVIRESINDSCRLLNKFREEEGKSLENDFRNSIKKITTYAEDISKSDKSRIEKIRKRIFQHLNNFLEENKIDKNRYEQEAIYYIEKLDITEELSRLKSHLDFFNRVLDGSQKEKGKKLNFIAQEIGREINTLGSKLNDAELQRVVVEMKDELEKIKEQTLNTL